MPDQFTTTSTTGYGSRIMNSIKGVLFGMILFAGSFLLLFWNEGRIDISQVAKTATEISSETVISDPAVNGKFISTTGAVGSPETIGDGMFLKPDTFLVVERKAEMYAWVEHESTQSRTNTGGSETTDTTYTYAKEWTDSSRPSSAFRHPEGHENFQPILNSAMNKVTQATIGAYRIDMPVVELPPLSPLQLTAQNTMLTQGAVLANDTYLYIPQNKANAFDNPQIGDMRVSYLALRSGTRGTLMGKLSGDSIVPYVDQNNTRIYRIFSGTTKEEAVGTLHAEYVKTTWILRGIGFFMMWFGLMLLFGPISVLMDILPIFGALTRSLIGLITFLASLALWVVTILVSMLLHNLIALAISIVVAIGVIIGVLIWLKKKKTVA